MQNEVVVPHLHHCQNLSEGTEKTREFPVQYKQYSDRDSTPGHPELKSIFTNNCEVGWANEVVASNDLRTTSIKRGLKFCSALLPPRGNSIVDLFYSILPASDGSDWADHTR
jgi:hypothetical protein